MAGLPHMAGNGPFPEPSGAPSMGCGIGGGGGCCGVMGCMGQRVWGCGDGCGDRCGMGAWEEGDGAQQSMGTEDVCGVMGVLGMWGWGTKEPGGRLRGVAGQRRILGTSYGTRWGQSTEARLWGPARRQVGTRISPPPHILSPPAPAQTLPFIHPGAVRVPCPIKAARWQRWGQHTQDPAVASGPGRGTELLGRSLWNLLTAGAAAMSSVPREAGR